MKSTASTKDRLRRKTFDRNDAIMAEITRLRDAAKEGRLSERADLSQVDENSKVLLWRVNDMLDAIIKPLNVTEKYIEDLSKGLIPPIITDDCNGDFNAIKDNLNAVINIMISTRNIAEIQIVRDIAETTQRPTFKKHVLNIRDNVARTFNRILASIFTILLVIGR
jgi:hypothetical protein